MKTLRFTTFLLAMAYGTVSVTVFASDFGSTEPGLYWRMEFGAVQTQPGPSYGLALRYRAESELPLPALVRFDITPTHFTTQFAGIPFSEHSYRAYQDEDETVPGEEPAASSPWYARKWVWWTAGGLALTAVLAGGESDTNNTTASNSGCANSGGCGIACANGECVVPCANFPDCVTLLPGTQSIDASITENTDRQYELDAGTGQMGDLQAR